MKESFGKAGERAVSLYTAENEKFLIKVTDFGARLVTLIDKATGIDVVQGFDDVSGYIENRGSYMGASVGRTANRIEKGEFTLNGKTYHLPINNNGNCNHGGIDGFDFKVWDAEETDHSVRLTYLSRDGEEGYPGDLLVTVVYELTEEGVRINVCGKASEDTLFAYTNHSFFNLDGSDTCYDHEVKVFSDRFALSDANGLALNQFADVKGTPFDFTEFKKLGKDIREDNEQLHFARGYDHFYPVDGEGLRTMAVCRGKKLELTMRSDLPGVHLYTSNWLGGEVGKYNRSYTAQSAVCFEGEYMPNAINYEGAKKPVVKAGEALSCVICYNLRPVTD